MSYALSIRSKKRLKGIDPILYKIAVEGCKDSPVDYGIPLTGGLRTADDQLELFNKKVSKCDGYNKKSYHQTGLAFDIYAYSYGKANWNVTDLTKIALHLQEFAKEKYNVDLSWGGNWTRFKDRPHFQIQGKK